MDPWLASTISSYASRAAAPDYKRKAIAHAPSRKLGPPPLQGATLRAFTFEGNPKRGAVTLEADGQPVAVIPTSDLRLSIAGGGPFEVRCRSLDDLDYELRVTWPPEHRAVIAAAEFDDWLGDRQLDPPLSDWGSEPRWAMRAVLALRVRFA